MSKRTLDFADGFESSQEPDGSALTAENIGTSDASDVQTKLDGLRTDTDANADAISSTDSDVDTLTDRVADAETDILALEGPQAEILLTEQGSSPTLPSAGEKKIFASTDGKLYTLNSVGELEQVGSGGGSGSGGVNYYPDPYFQNDSIVWSGQGGGDAGLTYEIDPDNEAIEGPAFPGAWIMRKTATNQFGKGFGYDIDIGPRSIGNGYVILKFNYTAETANLAAGDVKLRLLDPDAPLSVITPLALGSSQIDEDGLLGGVNVGTIGTIIAKIYLYPGQTQLRVAPVWNTTDTVAKGFVMSGLSLGPDSVVPGTISHGPKAFTPVWANAPGTATGTYARQGQFIAMTARLALTGPATGGYTVDLPSGLTPDLSAMIPNTSIRVGYASLYDISANQGYIGWVYLLSNGKLGIYGPDGDGAWGATVPTAAASGDHIEIQIPFGTFPITEWANSNPLISTQELAYKGARAVLASSNAPAIGTSLGKLTFNEEVYDGLNLYSAGTFTARESGEYEIDGFILTDSEAWSGGHLLAARAYINGSPGAWLGRRTFQAAITNRGELNIYGTVLLTAGQTLEIWVSSSVATNLINDAEWNRLTIKRINDLTAFAGYTPFEIYSTVSAAKTVSTSSVYQDMTNNSITLSPGVWELTGSFNATSESSGVLLRGASVTYALSDGASPTSLGGLLTHGEDRYISDDRADSWRAMQHPMPKAVVTLTAETTVFITGLLYFPSGSSHSLIVKMTAQRLR